MIPLKQDSTCTIFLHSWLNYHGYTLDYLQPFLIKSRWSYSIKHSELTDRLRADYSRFQESAQSLDDFFDRQIIICRGYNKKLFKINVDQINKIPIFIYQTTQKNTFLFGPDLSNLTSTNAIPCDLKIIMRIHGISKWPKDLSNFEPECGRTVAVYKVWKGKAYYDIDTVTDLADISIGLFKKQYYFIPNQKIVKGRYFCRKYPDQCHYNTTRSNHRNTHEKICANDSIITAKQVKFFFVSFLRELLREFKFEF